MLPRRYIFDNKYLLRRPDVEGPLVAAVTGDLPMEDIHTVDLTFVDYTLEELPLRRYYTSVDIEFFSAPVFYYGTANNGRHNEWSRDFRVTITEAELLRRTASMMVDDISIVKTTFLFKSLSWKIYDEFDPGRNRSINTRLLWRPPGPFTNIRHWHRLSSLSDFIDEPINWMKDGF